MYSRRRFWYIYRYFVCLKRISQTVVSQWVRAILFLQISSKSVVFLTFFLSPLFCSSVVVVLNSARLEILHFSDIPLGKLVSSLHKFLSRFCPVPKPTVSQCIDFLVILYFPRWFIVQARFTIFNCVWSWDFLIMEVYSASLRYPQSLQ